MKIEFNPSPTVWFKNLINEVIFKQNQFINQYGKNPECIYVDWLTYKKITIASNFSLYDFCDYKYLPINKQSTFPTIIGMEVIVTPNDFKDIQVGFKDYDEMVHWKMWQINKQEF